MWKVHIFQYPDVQQVRNCRIDHPNLEYKLKEHLHILPLKLNFMFINKTGNRITPIFTSLSNNYPTSIDFPYSDRFKRTMPVFRGNMVLSTPTNARVPFKILAPGVFKCLALTFLSPCMLAPAANHWIIFHLGGLKGTREIL